MPENAGIDPRSPRFAAAITSVLLLAALLVALLTQAGQTASFGWFAYQPLAQQTLSSVPVFTQTAFYLLVVVAALFLWGVLSPRTHPWAVLYRTAVAPRLSPPRERENPAPPRFAQGVGLAVTVAGIVLAAAGIPFAVALAAALAFIAAFLNAAFGLCLGCQLYLLLQRLRPGSPSTQ